MRKKTRVTLAVLTALLAGAGIGTAVGYGVWGAKKEASVQEPSSAREGEPAVSPALEEGSAVRKARAFRAPVLKAYSGADKDLLTIPAERSSYDTQYLYMSVNYDGQHGTYSPEDSKALMKVTHYRDVHSYAQQDRKSYYEDHLSALVTKIADEAKAHPGYRKIALIGEEYYGFTSGSQYYSTKAETFLYADNGIKNENAVSGGYSVLVLNISDVATVSDFKDNVLNKVTGIPAGDAKDATGYDYYVGIGYKLLEYKNSLTDGVTKDLYVDVDRNYSKDTIISSISAKDLFGKDVPVTVTEGLDTFTPQTIGVYTLKLKATDTYGQTATATLIVHICDYKAPDVTQSKALSFVADKGQKLAYADLTKYVSVTDNGTSHGSSLTVSYAYDGTAIDTSWAKTFVAADYGSHSLKVTARDGSGNETVKNFTLTVSDGTAPVISRKDGQPANSKITVGVSRTFNMKLSDILQMYKAEDNVDGDVSASLAGVGDEDKNFFANNNHVGSYTLHITAKDKDGNASVLNIPIVISADMPPVFIIADTIVYTDTDTHLSNSSLNNIVQNAMLAGKSVTNVAVDDSEYRGNEDKPGTYNITYSYTELTDSATKLARRLMANKGMQKSGMFSLFVTEAEKEAVEDGGKSFWKKIADWFRDGWEKVKDFFQRLGNWFKGVFTKFKFDCFVTDEEWDARFPAKKES